MSGTLLPTSATKETKLSGTAFGGFCATPQAAMRSGGEVFAIAGDGGVPGAVAGALEAQLKKFEGLAQGTGCPADMKTLQASDGGRFCAVDTSQGCPEGTREDGQEQGLKLCTYETDRSAYILGYIPPKDRISLLREILIGVLIGTALNLSLYALGKRGVIPVLSFWPRFFLSKGVGIFLVVAVEEYLHMCRKPDPFSGAK